MRDIGILVWVGLLIVGVVGSMISSLRRQSQLRQAPQRSRPRPQPQASSTPTDEFPPWLQRIAAQMAQQGSSELSARLPGTPPPAAAPPPTSERSSAPQATAARRAPVPPAPSPWPFDPVTPSGGHAYRTRASGLFAPANVVRAVIAAEVLGKPLALRDE